MTKWRRMRSGGGGGRALQRTKTNVTEIMGVNKRKKKKKTGRPEDSPWLSYRPKRKSRLMHRGERGGIQNHHCHYDERGTYKTVIQEKKRTLFKLAWEEVSFRKEKGKTSRKGFHNGYRTHKQCILSAGEKGTEKLGRQRKAQEKRVICTHSWKVHGGGKRGDALSF